METFALVADVLLIPNVTESVSYGCIPLSSGTAKATERQEVTKTNAVKTESNFFFIIMSSLNVKCDYFLMEKNQKRK